MAARITDRPRRAVAGVGTAIVIVDVAAAILFLPPVMNVGLEIAGSAAILGVPPEVARRASELSVQELLVGPGTFTFAATPGGPPFCGPAEAAHMQNVRVVVYGFFGLVSAGAITVAVSTRQMSGPSALRVIRLGATGLVLVVVAIGVGLGVAFDRLFTLLHQIVFPGGGWMFDPPPNGSSSSTQPCSGSSRLGPSPPSAPRSASWSLSSRRCVCAEARDAVRCPYIADG